MFSLTILGSGSAGNSALVTTDHCRLLVDGGLSARQILTRLELCGVRLEQLDGVLLRTSMAITSAALKCFAGNSRSRFIAMRLRPKRFARFDSLGEHRNWRFFRTGAEFSICDITVQTFPVPHDAVDPVGFAFHAGKSGLGFITDLGYPTKLLVERLRQVQTLVIETNHDEKMLQNDPHRPWPVKQRIQSRHGHLSNTAAASVIEQLLSGENRASRARPSQPRLQYAGARFRRDAGVARKM